jgi:hypothetical protein
MSTPMINEAPLSESPVPPLPVPVAVTPSPRSKSLVGRLLSALRGDKYLVDAYPPNWQGTTAATPDHEPPSAAQRPGV